MISQGCAHARACAEPATLRRNVAYSEFFNSIKFRVELITIQLCTQGRSEEYKCQIHELMFQADVKGMSERSELIPCNIKHYFKQE